MHGGIRRVRRRGIHRSVLLSLLLLALGPAVASADYTGTVDASTDTVTLTGSGDVQLSTGGGILHHNDLGAGFSDGTDFDSGQSGDQTVPDAAGWTIDITGGGSDTLEVDEGEATNPVTYEFGHNYFPGGTPCLYRAPEAFPGVVMDPDASQNLAVCYVSGFSSVTVRPGTGSIQYGVLDTQAGIPLYLYGGSGGQDQLTESADVPTSVGGYHNAASPVYFYGGSGPATISYDDDQGSTRETYTIGNGEISKTGQYPLYYSRLASGSFIVLYPQQGPSTIDVTPTGGVPVQIFGNFFSQAGPDTIDGAEADAPMYVTGSLGNDTITTSPVAGGDYFGGGGDPTIYATDNPSTEINCDPGGSPKGTVYVATREDDQISNCAAVVHSATKLTLAHLSFKSDKIKAGAKLTLRTPGVAAGRLTLTFALNRCTGKGHKRKCRYETIGMRTFNVKAGSASTTLSSEANEGSHHRLKKLAKDTYRVAIVETSGSLHSNTVELKLTIR